MEMDYDLMSMQGMLS